MKILFGTVLTILFLFSSGKSWAAHIAASAQGKGVTTAVAASNNASHNDILKKMNLKKFKTLEGRFAQTKFLKDLEVEIKTDGNFEVERSNSIFHWNVENPKPSQVCLDKTGIVLDSAGSRKKISFSEIGEDSGRQISSLLKLMSSDPEQLVQEFSVVAAPNQTDTFNLKPKKPENVFFESAQLHISKTGFVDKINLFEKSKDELRIQFSNLKADHTKSIPSCAL